MTKPSLIKSSLCAQWVAEDPVFLHVDSEDWSDWANAQADLNLHWGHRSFGWFGMRRLKWAASQENLSAGVCDQVWLEPASSTTEAS